MKVAENNYLSIHSGRLGIIVHPSCSNLGEKINEYIVEWRNDRATKNPDIPVLQDATQDSFIVRSNCSRFGTGEAKAIINDSVRGIDLYIIADVLNYSLEYTVCGHKNHMSPDDIYADIKRLIMAASGKPSKITVVMPFLYESRQHRRSARESLDCAYALQELMQMGVDGIITFDAHDPRIQNAIPIENFDNIMPTYQFIKTLLNSTDDLTLDTDHLMIISPDEGAMQRAIYFANVLEVEVGMFYKRRDYSTVIDGRNPIVAHEFLGSSVAGKDVIIIDDMLSSGESMFDVAKELKRRNARRIFCIATFGIFTKGLDPFDRAYKDGLIYKVITTNCTYQIPELFEKPWYISCDVSKYIATIIDYLNHDISISNLLDPHDKIKDRMDEYNRFHTIKIDE